MEGSPETGDDIPFRIFLKGAVELSPTIKTNDNNFEVRQEINIMIKDVDGVEYFKKVPIVVYRK